MPAALVMVENFGWLDIERFGKPNISFANYLA